MSKIKEKDVNKPKFKMPKLIFETSKPGQSKEDFDKEITAKHGNITITDASNLSEDEVKSMMEKMGMSMEDIEGMVTGTEQKKKPGLLQKMRDKFWD